MAASAPAASSSSYGRGARVLSIGIATTGLVTFAFFAVASHVLDEVDYKGISLLWSVLFIVTSVIYRPIEQLLSRSIAERRALGHAEHSLRVPLLLQGAFALGFLLVALALRRPLVDDVFDGSTTLYWVLVGSVLAYAASYFARGWLAGNQQFALYGLLVLFESVSRFLFPLAVAEMGLLAELLGGRQETVAGLAGAGDLQVTVTSGRNRLLGERVGMGMSGAEAFAELTASGTTTEGYLAAEYGHRLAKRAVTNGEGVRQAFPLLDALYRVLYEGAAAGEVLWEAVTKVRSA